MSRKYFFDFLTQVSGNCVIVTHRPDGHAYTFVADPVIRPHPVIDAPASELDLARSRVAEATIAARDALKAARACR